MIPSFRCLLVTGSRPTAGVFSTQPSGANPSVFFVFLRVC